MDTEKLIKMARAYQEALENDYCLTGDYEGCRPDEIALRIIDEILDEGEE